MKLLSNIALTYNDGLSGTKSTVVEAEIENFSRCGDCTQLGANYYLKDDTGAIIATGTWMIDNETDLQTEYDKIKADVPVTDDEPLRERTKVYLMFREYMIATLLPTNPSLTTADIDIVA